MRILILAGMLAVSTCWAQQAPVIPQDAPATSSQQSTLLGATSQPDVGAAPGAAGSPQAATQVAGSGQTVTIPAGARIPLRLVSQITGKARKGDAIRATTAFPVTVGTQMAIPVGSYAEGVIEKLNRRGPTVQLRFTRIVFPNGYTVAIEGTNVQAKASAGNSNRRDSNANASVSSASHRAVVAQARLAGFADAPGHVPYAGYAEAFAGEGEPNAAPPPQQQQPPPLPPLHTHTGLIVGLAAGSTAVVVVIALLAHRSPYGGVAFDVGWQFDMVLEQPATVDLASAAKANSQ
jgi:hypothetical protein